MERVTGIGGVFFKAQDPAALAAWYAEHLGVVLAFGHGATFTWGAPDATEPGPGMTVWSPFPAATSYFAPSAAPFMINYRVRQLDPMLAQLRAAGVAVDERVEESEFGRFGWAMDPEGNRIELWEPPSGA
jgi:catechol 2,3-dioxygenase-like lactoylglutathione lyase family enzyme